MVTLEVDDETIAGSNQESLAVSQPHIDVRMKMMSCDAIDKVRRLDSGVYGLNWRCRSGMVAPPAQLVVALPRLPPPPPPISGPLSPNYPPLASSTTLPHFSARRSRGNPSGADRV